MTVSVPTNQNLYDGNDVTTVFPYSYRINKDSDLRVVVGNPDDIETVLTLTTHYTVSDAGEPTGSITTEDLTAITGQATLPTGWDISIRRLVDVTQLTDIINQGNFFAQTHENVFDYLTMICQQQQNELDRCPKVTETSGDEGDDLMAAINAAVLAAENSAAAAAVSAAAALVSETNAGVSETNAAASAAAAAAAAASGMYANVQDKTGDYPVVEADEGDLIRIDTSGGLATITMPLISTLTADFRVAIVKWTPDNYVVDIIRSGSDTINGGTKVSIAGQYDSYTLVADVATDTWAAITTAPAIGSVTVDRFNGTGAQVAFTLSEDPGTENNTRVFVSGVYIQKDVYSTSGTTLTFDAAPAGGTDNIEIFYSTALGIGVPSDNSVSTIKLVDGAVTADKLGTDAVTTAKIDADAVTGDEIADNAIDTEHLADDAVGDAEIDWGTGANQVSLDSIPEGTTTKGVPVSALNATLSGDQTLLGSGEIVEFDTAVYDPGSEFNAGTYSFVADETRLYSVGAVIKYESVGFGDVETYIESIIDGVGTYIATDIRAKNSTVLYSVIGGIVPLKTGDSLRIFSNPPHDIQVHSDESKFFVQALRD